MAVAVREAHLTWTKMKPMGKVAIVGYAAIPSLPQITGPHNCGLSQYAALLAGRTRISGPNLGPEFGAEIRLPNGIDRDE
jgi:hypothetical protein